MRSSKATSSEEETPNNNKKGHHVGREQKWESEQNKANKSKKGKDQSQKDQGEERSRQLGRVQQSFSHLHPSPSLSSYPNPIQNPNPSNPSAQQKKRCEVYAAAHKWTSSPSIHPTSFLARKGKKKERAKIDNQRKEREDTRPNRGREHSSQSDQPEQMKPRSVLQ